MTRPVPLVKICGLSTVATLEAALGAGADLVGFVFFERSPRFVAPSDSALLGRLVGARARKVALTVDEGDDVLDGIVAALRPDLVQLHGKESPERVSEVKARYGLPVIKAIGIAGKDDLARAESYRGSADWLLLDAKPPKGAALPGGNGVAFDWTLLERFGRSTPMMLSGGLDPRSVAEAIRVVHPEAVDVSSGVEDRPGVKNPDKIRDFIHEAKAAALHEEPAR
jgi:phosphoribosylanthranilate isomerase